VKDYAFFGVRTGGFTMSNERKVADKKKAKVRKVTFTVSFAAENLQRKKTISKERERYIRQISDKALSAAIE